MIAALTCLLLLPQAQAPDRESEYVYALPFKGKARRVSQASDGVTHKGKGRHALDFPMPRRTKIHAAREGVVVRAIDKNEEPLAVLKQLGLASSKANVVVIRHSDGTRAVYAHLDEGGAAVKVGRKVKRGEHIGFSGNTGKSSGPHLHFAVYKPGEGSVRVRFRTAGTEATFLERGKRYRNPEEVAGAGR